MVAPGRAEALKQNFATRLGSLYCRELRAAKVHPCETLRGVCRRLLRPNMNAVPADKLKDDHQRPKPAASPVTAPKFRAGGCGHLSDAVGVAANGIGCGILFALVIGHPFADWNHNITKWLLPNLRGVAGLWHELGRSCCGWDSTVRCLPPRPSGQRFCSVTGWGASSHWIK